MRLRRETRTPIKLRPRRGGSAGVGRVQGRVACAATGPCQAGASLSYKGMSQLGGDAFASCSADDTPARFSSGSRSIGSIDAPGSCSPHQRWRLCLARIDFQSLPRRAAGVALMKGPLEASGDYGGVGKGAPVSDGVRYCDISAVFLARDSERYLMRGPG